MRVSIGVVLVGATSAGCSDGDDTRSPGSPRSDAGVATDAPVAGPTELPEAVLAALAAVDEALGGPQTYFEVTATAQFTNVFVAVDDATAAVPYVVRDGAVEAPAPTLEDVSGFTFVAADVVFDAAVVLGRVATELPGATIQSLSVEGADTGAPRLVVAVLSGQGGRLDVVVTPDGAIISVEPV
jgi:hypothetical protein